MRSPKQSPTARALRLSALLTSAALVALSLGALAACGSSSEDPPADGPPDGQQDGPPKPRVQEIDCPTSVAVEIKEVARPGENPAFVFSPSPAIVRAGSVVKFNLSAQHDAYAAGIFKTQFGAPTCYRFNRQESIEFACTAHGFKGRLIIQ